MKREFITLACFIGLFTGISKAQLADTVNTISVTEAQPLAVSMNANIFCLAIKTDGAEGNDESVFPNPNNGEFKIKTFKNSLVMITDSKGEVVYRATILTGKAKISLKGLASGTYFVKLTSRDKQQVITMIKS